MAALPPSNTGRVWVDYATANAEHSFMLRYPVGSSSAVALEVAASFLEQVSTDLHVINIRGARFALKDTDVTLPLTWPGELTYGNTQENPVNAPRFVSLVGRTVAGRRWLLQLYGWKGATPDSYRVSLGNFTGLENGVQELQGASDEGVICGIDGHGINFYDYFNVNYNDHWVSEARSGG